MQGPRSTQRRIKRTLGSGLAERRLLRMGAVQGHSLMSSSASASCCYTSALQCHRHLFLLQAATWLHAALLGHMQLILPKVHRIAALHAWACSQPQAPWAASGMDCVPTSAASATEAGWAASDGGSARASGVSLRSRSARAAAGHAGAPAPPACTSASACQEHAARGCD